MVASSSISALQGRLIARLERLPASIRLTPLNGNKQPQGKEWTNRFFTPMQMIDAVRNGVEVPFENEPGEIYHKRIYPKGFGLMTGPASGGILAADFDGASALEKFIELNGGLPPVTEGFTSRHNWEGEYPDHFQLTFWVPQVFWGSMKNKVAIPTKREIDPESGKEKVTERLELRWSNMQSVLPPSIHPETGSYRDLPGRAFGEIERAEAPMWVIEQMLGDSGETKAPLLNPQSQPQQEDRWTDKDWALSYLNALSSYRADDYDDWLAVGMALHSVNDSLLRDWDNWSCQSTKYKPGDCEKKWKSFKSKGVAIGTLAHMAKQDGWRSPFDKPTGRGYGGGIGSGGSNGGGRRGGSGGSGGGDGGDGGDRVSEKVINHPKFTPLNDDELERRIDDLISKKITGSKLTTHLNRLAAEAQWHVTELKKLYFERKGETEQIEEQAEAQSLLPSLLEVNRLNLREFLWGDDGLLAEAILETAKAMPTSPEFLFTTLIPAAATLIGTSSRIIVKAKGKYKQPCIFWTAVVARSGQLKTPAQTVVLDPLVRLEIKASEQYQLDLEQYEINLANWKKDKDADPADKPNPPVRKRYVTKDATIEALERIHGQNPRGLLVHRDEIAEDFKADNAYRNGKGGDREKKLDQFNGSPLIIDRKEREIALERSAISRTGSIQWDILQSLMGDGRDDNGTFARWLFCAAEAPPRYINLLEDDDDTGVEELLMHLYRRLEKMPDNRDYLLSFEAKELFQQWQHELVRAELEESHPGLQLVYPKIEAYTARFALWLHVVNAALAEVTPPAVISEQIMAAAIKLAKYYLEQSKLVMVTNTPQSGLTGVLLKIQKYAQGKPNGVKVYKLKSAIKALRNKSQEEMLSHCQWLSEHGYGLLTENVYFVDQLLPKRSTRSTPDSDVILANSGNDLLTNCCPEVNTVNTSNDGSPSHFVDFVDQSAPPNGDISVTEVNNTPGIEFCNEKEQGTIEVVNMVNTVNNSSETHIESGVDHGQGLVNKGQQSQKAEIEAVSKKLAVGDRVLACGVEGEVERINPEFQEAPYQVASDEFVQWFAADDLQLLPPTPQPALEKPREAKVGDRVFWDECPPHCASFAPFEITAIDGAYAKLDIIEKLVPTAELRKA